MMEYNKIMRMEKYKIIRCIIGKYKIIYNFNALEWSVSYTFNIVGYFVNSMNLNVVQCLGLDSMFWGVWAQAKWKSSV